MIEIIPWMDKVTVAGVDVPRPSYVSRMAWMKYWEAIEAATHERSLCNVWKQSNRG